MVSPSGIHARPPSAIPKVCAVCGGARRLDWHPYAFEFADALGVVAIFFGIVHKKVWRMNLPACERCRARGRWGGLAMLAGLVAGTVVSLLLLLFLAGLAVESLLVYALVLAPLAPLAAGAYLGNRWRGRVWPKTVRVREDELAITIPGYGLLHLISRNPAAVGVVPAPATIS
ncbi:MAG TPA: hypothetical protein VFJ16_16755 [Longimicrobium sp.]|nr:hypothetical protein [Longimicrobium sp.]